jgi:MoaA/NifB/PqqE/SkfB family radical SAM enzyme
MHVDKAKPSVDPRHYFEGVRADSDRPAYDPVCLYLETTNRCNLLCTTCPRTYEELEPPADMSWQLFCSIVDQIPNLSRAVLHGVGEPMLVKNLPRMVRYLKDRGTYVLFNTNGTVLNEKNGRALIEAGLDELRVSFDAANAESYKAIRGKNYFNRILRNVRAFREMQEREGHSQPRVSAWLTGLRETVEQLPDFVRLAAKPASGKSICSGWSSSRKMPSARHGRIRRCTGSCPARRQTTSIAPPTSPHLSACALAPQAPPRSRG